jgi:hypothetical protein
MVDIEDSVLRPDSVWRALGRSLAAGAGALTALLSLLSGTSLSTACARGAVALFGALLLTRIGAAALASIEAVEERTLREDEEQLGDADSTPGSN